MKRTLWICLCAALFTPVLGCYPTTTDIENFRNEDHEFVAGLHEAGNKLMGDQHAAIAPELEERFDVMYDQYLKVSAELKRVGGLAKAEGPSISGLSGFGGGVVPSLLSMFGLGSLIPIWNMFFGKSRAASEITELKHQLAVKAGSDQEIPG